MKGKAKDYKTLYSDCRVLPLLCLFVSLFNIWTSTHPISWLSSPFALFNRGGTPSSPTSGQLLRMRWVHCKKCKLRAPVEEADDPPQRHPNEGHTFFGQKHRKRALPLVQACPSLLLSAHGAHRSLIWSTPKKPEEEARGLAVACSDLTKSW